MTIHRCPLPDGPTRERFFACPDCDARYFWSRRMVRRQMREGWQRAGFTTLAATGQRPVTDHDDEFSWFKRWFALVVAGYAIGFFLVVALIVWVVVRFTS